MIRSIAIATGMLKALHRNGNVLQAGQLRSELHGEFGVPISDGAIQTAARLIRDRGIPLITKPGRQNSLWKIAPPGSYDYDVWVNWILKRHYNESVTGFRSLAPDPRLKQQKNALYQSAIQSGILIGLSTAEINHDLNTPIPVEPELQAVLNPTPTPQSVFTP